MASQGAGQKNQPSGKLTWEEPAGAEQEELQEHAGGWGKWLSGVTTSGHSYVLSLVGWLWNCSLYFIKLALLCKVNTYWQDGAFQINAGSSKKKIKFFHAYQAAATIHVAAVWKKLVVEAFFNTSQYWPLFLSGEVCWKWTMWASHVLQWLGGSQFELLPFALSPIMIFIFPWHLPRLSMPPA